MAHWTWERLETDLSPRPLRDALQKANFITAGMSLDASGKDSSLSPIHKLTIKSGPYSYQLDRFVYIDLHSKPMRCMHVYSFLSNYMPRIDFYI